MRTDRDISRRVRDMLTQDNLLVGEGFVAALKSDIGKTADSYFALCSPIAVDICRDERGTYAVKICFSASDVRRFDTTMDIKRF